MNGFSWLLWAIVLFFQNISFTYVSRARSSGSLVRHLKASIFSNSIWIFSNMLMLGPMFEYLTGKHGRGLQVVSGVVYTVACVGGSIFAHYLAMKTEKGKNAVGYSAKYAQIPVAEWERIKATLQGSFTASEGELIRTRGIYVDTGDGIGTFTVAEIGKLKELTGTILETVDEIVNESFPVEALPCK
jgi:hypothetical protein